MPTTVAPLGNGTQGQPPQLNSRNAEVCGMSWYSMPGKHPEPCVLGWRRTNGIFCASTMHYRSEKERLVVLACRMHSRFLGKRNRLRPASVLETTSRPHSTRPSFRKSLVKSSLAARAHSQSPPRRRHIADLKHLPTQYLYWAGSPMLRIVNYFESEWKICESVDNTRHCSDVLLRRKTCLLPLIKTLGQMTVHRHHSYRDLKRLNKDMPLLSLDGEHWLTTTKYVRTVAETCIGWWNNARYTSQNRVLLLLKFPSDMVRAIAQFH